MLENNEKQKVLKTPLEKYQFQNPSEWNILNLIWWVKKEKLLKKTNKKNVKNCRKFYLTNKNKLFMKKKIFPLISFKPTKPVIYDVKRSTDVFREKFVTFCLNELSTLKMRRARENSSILWSATRTASLTSHPLASSLLSRTIGSSLARSRFWRPTVSTAVLLVCAIDVNLHKTKTHSFSRSAGFKFVHERQHIIRWNPHIPKKENH